MDQLEPPRSELELMMEGHGLTTANIYYHMPDFDSVLQNFVWQEYDLAPDFPKLLGFLDFWKAELDGRLHSVQYTHQKLIRPGEWRNVDGEFRLH
ncbi:usg protein [Pseudahrensia aquimaris]|uniref:Usg protein n=1 Tax=Pseudahrensia aquimaris TaxID=744461 RepID=A0ABW3FHY4_9HYPH